MRDPNADFNQLHALMLEGRSDKEPAALTAANFASYFERAYARGMQWRVSAQREQQKDPAILSQIQSE